MNGQISLNIRTVFSVVERNNSNTTFGGILGDDSANDFIAGSGNAVLGADAHIDIRNGLFRLNGSAVDGTTSTFPDSNYSIITIRSTGNVEASRIGKDRAISDTQYHFDGGYAELLVYDIPLTDKEIERVEGYLAHKWGLAGDLPNSHSYKSESNSSLGEEFLYDSNLSLESFQYDFFSHEQVYKNSDLLSRWRFEEQGEIIGGKIAWDVGLGKNHGYFTGDAKLGAGRFGKGLILDGDGDYLDIPHFRGLFEDTDFTLSVWLQLDDIGVDNDQQDAAIFATDGDGDDNLLLWYDVNSIGTANRSFSFNLGSVNNNLNRINAPDSLAVQGIWHHLVVSVNGDIQSLYLDGEEIVFTDFAGTGRSLVEGNTLRLGAWGNSPNHDFSGILDEVRIYQTAFDANDVSVLYGGGIGDLGIVPNISVDARHSDDNISLRVDFYQFGQLVSVSDFNESDVQVAGGIISGFQQDGSGFLFGVIPDAHPSRIDISLSAGAAKYGSLTSTTVTKRFSHYSPITGADDLALWYAFEEAANANEIEDFSDGLIDGVLQNGSRVAGKFSQSLRLEGNGYVSANAEPLSLSSNLTISMWSKILDDSQGVLVRCGQFSLRYHDDNSIRASVYTGSSWKEVETESLSGRWTHYAFTYDGVELKFYSNGILQDSIPVTGYMKWGDGSDHNLYLGSYGTSGWNAKAEIDDFRVYRRAFSEGEVSRLYGHGTGDMGIRPSVNGDSPFVVNPTNQSITFMEGNASTYISGLVQGEVNASGANVMSFLDDSSSYNYDLNVTAPPIVRVAIPYGAVEKDGNLSQAVSFEFNNRLVTSVEDGLLAWYDFDEMSEMTAMDKSGRMRHAKYISDDATSKDSGDASSSHSFLSPYSYNNAFDNDASTANGRWLARRDNNAAVINPQIDIKYDFGVPTIIGEYRIVSQHWRTNLRSPKSWQLEGSADDSSWTVLHSISNEENWSAWEARDFIVPSPSAFQYYRLAFSEATGVDNYLGIAEIEFFPAPVLQQGKFTKALDLNGEYLELPFRVDQGSFSEGLTFSAWVKPDQVMGGHDNERQVFSTDDGGWDWSMSIRYGLLSVWNGSSRIQSGLQTFPDEWYHVVSVFDPVMGRTILHLNGKTATLDSLGFDNDSNRLQVGMQRDGRTFDGLVDDVRVWGRPLNAGQVLGLWGNGMGDLGPRFDLLVDSPVYGDEINATVLFNQPINDFNASSDLDLVGVTLLSSTSDTDSNLSSYQLVLKPISLADGNLSVTLKGNAVTGQFGMKNDTVSKLIDFRPHRVRENDMVLWWQLDDSLGKNASDSIGQNIGNITNESWANESESKFGSSSIRFDKTNGRAIRLGSGLPQDLTVCSLSFWVNPQSPDFYLFNLDGISPELSISLRKQRPLFYLSGLNQQSLPGTSGEEFWANGYVSLNKWSHIVLSYSLDNRRVRFYINGEFEGEASFANNQIFPFSKSFRLGPLDGTQSTETEGLIDDFRIYAAELNLNEVSKLYGSGFGDFHSRTIAIKYSSNFQHPKPVTIEFLEDGFPVELNATNTPGGFTTGDLSVTNGTVSNIAPDVNDPGVYVVHLTPSDENQTLDMNLSVTGSGVSTKTFGDTFSNVHAVIPYSVKPPEIHSTTLSHWAVGKPGVFNFITLHGRSFSISGEPAWMDFNSTTGQLSGTPPVGSTNKTIIFSVENPHSTKVQNHQIKVFDPNVFTARMDIDPIGVNSGENPQNLPGLILHLDGNQISEFNGTEITKWDDVSGTSHPLDRVRGKPVVILGPELQNKKVVRFNGFSQLYSTFDFGSALTEYTVLALARHSGSQRNTVIGSVGTDWVFGLGGGSTSYWKMGSEVFPPTSVDEDWHLYAGALSSQGDAILWRDQFKVDNKQIALTFDSVPKYFALGGTGTNENFSTSEVAEVLLYDRVLSDSELSDLQNYLRSKWLGGSVENFPMMVRLNYNNVPAFGLNGHNTFSDPNSGGDLRIYDESNQELIYEIDEWNVSGETLIWVQVPELTVSSKIHAYWGNDSNISSPAYRTNGSLWSNYEGVWHFEADGSDSSIHSRAATGNNGAMIGVPALAGRGFTLNGSNDLTVNGYIGISGSSARSISLWMKSSDVEGGLIGWGDAANRWDFGWNLSGPLVKTSNTSKEQGRFTLGDNQWHHVALSYSQNSDLNETMLFIDGNLVDAPNLSQSALVNTGSGGDLKIGSFYNGDQDANGTYDEVRISSIARGAAWFKYSYDNQKDSSSFLKSELNFLREPVFESDLNVTVMKGENMSFQVRTIPPATSYVLNSAPSGITINSATGIITGTPNWTGDQSISVDASNAKGTASTAITIHALDAKSLPVISSGSVSDISGRSVVITGELLNPGAAFL